MFAVREVYMDLLLMHVVRKKVMHCSSYSNNALISPQLAGRGEEGSTVAEREDRAERNGSNQTQP